jgi:hypothetical protein
VGANSVAGRACANSQGVPAALSTFTSLTISKVVISGSSATVAFNGSSEVMILGKQNGYRSITRSPPALFHDAVCERHAEYDVGSFALSGRPR